MSGNGMKLRLGRRTVEVSSSDKVYFPGDGITKGDLVDYYRRMADVMLPYVRGRALTMHRFPDGIEADGFFQQQRPDFLPDWVGGAELPRRSGGSVRHPVVDSGAELVALVDTGCITPHVWLSRIDAPERPDRMVFDLDPPGEDFSPVRSGAVRLRALLQEIGFEPLVKTTGSAGLHVVVPLRREHDFEEVRDLARRIAAVLVDRHSDDLTLEHRKDRREGKLYLDILRNAYGQHVVAPYAVRALPAAPVATPLDWSEVRDPDTTPRGWTVGNIFRRLGQREDPWKGAWRSACGLDRPRRRIEGIERDRDTS